MIIPFFKTFAQQSTKDDAEVREVVKRLFHAMQLGDSALARSVFDKQVTTATVFKDKNGAVVMRREDSIMDFMKAIGTPHQEVWYEEIWNLTVQLDGDFAQAWCDYAFYVDNKFSHCGVDAFHLYRSKEGWRIFHLADTRRKTECVIPKEIEEKHR